jgi:KipI family sensor histidine kinase inhibitor
MAGPAFAVHRAGPGAVLIEFDHPHLVQDYYAEARRRQADQRLPAGLELVPAAQTLLVAGLPDTSRFRQDLAGWRPEPAQAAHPREREIPTRYDGPDLAWVAQAWGLDVSAAVRRHAELEFEVAFLGFAPGFAYLLGLPSELAVPRRSSPRTLVPAGSVGLAGEFTGVYPRPSPGGWQLIGHTGLSLWDEHREPAAYLLPGDRVRFVPVP